MKLTKQQLQKIIQEELETMQQEGELDEGFLDRLFGKDKRSTDFVTDQEVKDVIGKVINSISELVRTASRQENIKLADKAAELKRTAMGLSSLAIPIGKDLTPQDFSTGQKFPSAARSTRASQRIKMTPGE